MCCLLALSPLHAPRTFTIQLSALDTAIYEIFTFGETNPVHNILLLYSSWWMATVKGLLKGKFTQKNNFISRSVQGTESNGEGPRYMRQAVLDIIYIYIYIY